MTQDSSTTSSQKTSLDEENLSSIQEYAVYDTNRSILNTGL